MMSSSSKNTSSRKQKRTESLCTSVGTVPVAPKSAAARKAAASWAVTTIQTSHMVPLECDHGAAKLA